MSTVNSIKCYVSFLFYLFMITEVWTQGNIPPPALPVTPYVIDGFYSDLKTNNNYYYIRQVRNQIFGFAESPGQYTVVFKGYIQSNTIRCTWYGIPYSSNKKSEPFTFAIITSERIVAKLGNIELELTRKILPSKLPFIGGPSVNSPIYHGFQCDQPSCLDGIWIASNNDGFLSRFFKNPAEIWGIKDFNKYGHFMLAEYNGEIVGYGQNGGAINPRWATVIFGKRIGNKFSLNYYDIPRGRNNNSGLVTLSIDKTGKIMTRESANGGWGFEKLYRSRFEK